jgi:hypothetical protein
MESKQVPSPKVLFDVREQGYRNWWFSLIGFGIMGIGLACYANRDLDLIWHGWPMPVRIGWCYFFSGFGCLWTALVSTSTLREYLDLNRALAGGRYQVDEGEIRELRTFREGTAESFWLNNKIFKYNYAQVTSAFNITSSRGSPLREGLFVRVFHTRGCILRIEALES